MNLRRLFTFGWSQSSRDKLLKWLANSGIQCLDMVNIQLNGDSAYTQYTPETKVETPLRSI